MIDSGAAQTSGSCSVFYNQQEQQELKDEIKELKLELSLRNSCLRQFIQKFQNGSLGSKSLILEEAFFGSKSMQTLCTQVSKLIKELETRENLES